MHMKTDAQGLIVTQAGDAGDCLHNHATLEFHRRLRQDLLGHSIMPDLVELERAGVCMWGDTAIGVRRHADQLLEKKPGLWVRHPDPSKWYSDEETTSRDALIPTLGALGINKQYRALGRLCWQLAKRGFTAPNVKHNWNRPGRKPFGDPFWGHITAVIRPWGRWAWPLYPLMLILDLTLLVGAIIDAVKPLSADDSDDRNAINMHMMAVRWMPTPISFLSRMIYSKTRPMCFGMAKQMLWPEIDANKAAHAPILPLLILGGATHPVAAAWRWYCHYDFPELGEVAMPLIFQYFPAPQHPRRNREAA